MKKAELHWLWQECSFLNELIYLDMKTRDGIKENHVRVNKLEYISFSAGGINELNVAAENSCRI